jgi:hypothetical protein
MKFVNIKMIFTDVVVTKCAFGASVRSFWKRRVSRNIV